MNLHLNNSSLAWLHSMQRVAQEYSLTYRYALTFLFEPSNMAT